MHSLPDLTDKTRSERNEIVSCELRDAGIEVRNSPGFDMPTFRGFIDIQGILGKWHFSRQSITYAFWGDVPLATAEAIAADSECKKGCMPQQWFPCWGNQPNPEEVHAKLTDHVSWIEDGMFRVKDEGRSEDWKDAMQSDACHKLRFVDDPSAAGKPCILTYTFFTPAALKNFVVIAKRHRVDFAFTH